MNDTAVKLTSGTYDPSAKGRYHLSFGLADRAVSCAVLDIHEREYVALIEHTSLDPNALTTSLDHCQAIGLKGLEPVSVSAYIKGGAGTLVPSGSFSRSQAHHLLALTQSAELNSGVLHETIPSMDVEMLYVQDAELSNAVLERYPNCKIYDARTVFLDAIGRRSESAEVQMHLQVWESEMDLAIFKKGELKLFNSHFHSSAEDILYHCVFALDRCGIDRNKVTIHLTGKMENDNDLKTLLSKYFRSGQNEATSGTIKRAEALKVRDHETDLLLFELYQCG